MNDATKSTDLGLGVWREVPADEVPKLKSATDLAHEHGANDARSLAGGNPNRYFSAEMKQAYWDGYHEEYAKLEPGTKASMSLAGNRNSIAEAEDAVEASMRERFEEGVLDAKSGMSGDDMTRKRVSFPTALDRQLYYYGFETGRLFKFGRDHARRTTELNTTYAEFKHAYRK